MRHTALAACLCAAAASAFAQPQPACAAAEHRQFDFWIGTWEVTTPDGKVAGENRIEAIANGCALLENWQGRSGFSGKSVNIFDRLDRRWHQEWVDSSGLRLTLAGRWAEGRMLMEGTLPNVDKPGQTVQHRISWTPAADGSVRQLWETSADGGKTWNVAFDGKYVRKK
ncbi:MAG: hypothetical protein AB1430_13340 [Pseudomonadota bacterium]